MHLVDSPPSSEPWGLWKNHLTCYLFFWQQRKTGSAQSLQGVAGACNMHSCPLGVLMRTYHLLCVQSRHEIALCSHSFISVSVHIVTHRCLLFSDSPTPLFPLDPLPPNLLSLSLFLLFYCSVEQKLSFGMAKRLLRHFMILSFRVESSEKEF